MDPLSEASGDPLPGDCARCYRPRRYYLYLGVACTLFFFVMGVGSTTMALWNTDGSFARPVLAACIFGAFWSGFTLLGVWLVWHSVRSRLVISTTHVRSVGCFRTTTIPLDDVTRAAWRLCPKGGSIVLRAGDRKLTIELGNYAEDARAELIKLFRGLIDHELQEGWPRFCEQLSAESRDERLCRVVMAVLFAGFGAFYFRRGMAGRGVPFLVLSVVNLLAVLYLLRGRVARKTPDRTGDEAATNNRQSQSPTSPRDTFDGPDRD